MTRSRSSLRTPHVVRNTPSRPSSAMSTSPTMQARAGSRLRSAGWRNDALHHAGVHRNHGDEADEHDAADNGERSKHDVARPQASLHREREYTRDGER